MTAHVIRRLAALSLSTFAGIIIVYLLLETTGFDPCLTSKATETYLQSCHDKWGLDDPLHVRLGSYLWNILQLDFGESYQYPGRSVMSVIWSGLPHTLTLVVLSFPMATLLGSIVGVLSALRHNSRTDYILMGGSLVGMSVPSFVLGPVLILILIVWLDWIPVTQGLRGPSSYLLPVLTLGLPTFAGMARFARAGMLEVLREDYIRTAHAKGLPPWRIVVKHALRLGMTPVLTYSSPALVGMMTGGSFVVEKIFGIPGLGLLFTRAASANPMDTPMILATVVIITVLFGSLNMLVDIGNVIRDPRLRGRGDTQNHGGVIKSLLTVVGLTVSLLVGLTVALSTWRIVTPALVWVKGNGDLLRHLPFIASIAWALLGIWIWRKRRTLLQSRSANDRELYESPGAKAWKRFLANRAAVLSVVILYLTVLACLLGPWGFDALLHITYKTQDDTGRLAPAFAWWYPPTSDSHWVLTRASWAHPLGTDDLGRDLLVRTLSGGRVSLSIGILGLSVALPIGIYYGALSGYFGGAVDNVMQRVLEMLAAIPALPLVIILVAVVGNNIYLLFMAIAGVSWLVLAQVMRGQVQSICRLEYIVAARAVGESELQIIRRHIVPNAIGPIVVYAARLVSLIILDEAFLSFLGFGVQETMASLGTLIEDGRANMETMWWMLLFPGVLYCIVVLCLGYLGDAVRDALDTKLT